MTFSVHPPALRTYAGQLAAAGKAADTAASTWTGWRVGDGEGSYMGEISPRTWVI